MDQKLAANRRAAVDHYLGKFLVDGAFPPKTFDFQDQRRCLIQGAHLTALANMGGEVLGQVCWSSDEQIKTGISCAQSALIRECCSSSNILQEHVAGRTTPLSIGYDVGHGNRLSCSLANIFHA